MNIEITPLTIWLFTRLEYVNALIVVGVLICFFVAGLSCVKIWAENLKGTKATKLWLLIKRSLIILVCLITIGVIIPNQNEVVAMYVIPKIVNSEYVHKIGEKGLDSIENLIDYTNDVLKEKIKK